MAKPKAETFFTPEEQERISGAVREAELRTIGEIAVMVVNSSDQYREAEVLGGALLGSAAAFVVSLAAFQTSVWAYVPLSAVFGIAIWALLRKVPGLKTPFVSRQRKDDAVRRGAIRAFYEKGLYRTRQGSGVLFFVSILERKVWVLADRGIYEKVRQETLDRFAGEVSMGIRDGRSAEALCYAIHEAGDLLARYFPAVPGNRNELSDRIITGE